MGTGELLKNCRTVLHMPIQVYMLTIKQPIGISEKGFDCALGCLRKTTLMSIYYGTGVAGDAFCL